MKAILAFAQRRLLLLMVVCYLLAGLFPGPGQALRPAGPVLLAVMVFNAGLGFGIGELLRQIKRPGRLLLGVGANALLPAVILPLVAVLISGWHDGREVSGLLIGLALVLSMPIAGGAAAWGQNAGGNVALTVAMVLGSTLLSPLTIPVGLHIAGEFTSGLEPLNAAGAGCGLFALAGVVLPCIAALGVRHFAGERRVTAVTPVIKTVNLVDILLLCYSNASAALPRVVAHPDVDLLVLVAVVAAGVCAACFLLGRWLSGRTRCDRRDAIALTFATGMNNSSAASVLAGTWFIHRPVVLLPILAYSLLQKSLAATIRFRQAPPRGSLRAH